MALRSLQKWHGAGNDFLVEVQEYGRVSWWTPERVRALCARTTGVGADGLVIATMGPHVAMTLYNADGSSAEMSGNGVRCLAAAVRRATGAAWDTLEVDTAAGRRSVHLVMDETSDDTVGDASVAMGEVTFGPPLEGTLGVAYVGNPHVVVIDDDEWSDAEREARAEECSRQVGGANVEFIRVLDRGHVALRVIERGVGWTQACGTGSCAVAGLARRAGLVDDEVEVDNPGGPLRVALDGAQATLSGPVRFVANVEWLEA